jgi:undecaprenyl diphosphate synthase
VIIRTGGEKRLSNFLLWQSAYSELFFSDTLWPDFDCTEFLSILSDFNNRDRRFGDVKR